MQALHVGWCSEPAYHPINIENRYPRAWYTVTLFQKFIPSDDDDDDDDKDEELLLRSHPLSTATD